jgi:hypothetical protein
MNWDGKTISGMINPGPDKVLIKTASLDTSKWTFHLETDAKDPNCAVQHFVAEGKLDNIGSYNRTVTGTYTYGTTKGRLQNNSRLGTAWTRPCAPTRRRSPLILKQLATWQFRGP